MPMFWLDLENHLSNDVTVPADEFIHTCLEHFSGASAQLLSKGHRYAFSLGLKVEIHNLFGHTNDHLREMASLVKHHDLIGQCAGKHGRMSVSGDVYFW